MCGKHQKLDLKHLNKTDKNGITNNCRKESKMQTKGNPSGKFIDMNLKSVEKATVQSHCIIEMPCDEELDKITYMIDISKPKINSPENVTKEKPTNSQTKYRPICKYYMNNKCYSRKCIYLHPISLKNVEKPKPVPLLNLMFNHIPTIDLFQGNENITPAMTNDHKTNQSILLDQPIMNKNNQDVPSHPNIQKYSSPIPQNLANIGNYSVNLIPSQYETKCIISQSPPNANNNYQMNENQPMEPNLYYPNYTAFSHITENHQINSKYPATFKDYATEQINLPNTAIPPPVLQLNPATSSIPFPATHMFPKDNQFQMNQTYNSTPAYISEKKVLPPLIL